MGSRRLERLGEGRFKSSTGGLSLVVPTGARWTLREIVVANRIGATGDWLAQLNGPSFSADRLYWFQTNQVHLEVVHLDRNTVLYEDERVVFNSNTGGPNEPEFDVYVTGIVLV